jgi:predicted transcriptional regulator
MITGRSAMVAMRTRVLAPSATPIVSKLFSP